MKSELKQHMSNEDNNRQDNKERLDDSIEKVVTVASYDPKVLNLFVKEAKGRGMLILDR